MNALTRLTIQDVRAQLVSLSPDIARSLPPGVSPERFTTVSLTAIQNAPKLLECEPQSLFNACMKAAQDGLLPDGREGAIIPRYNSKTRQTEATWQPMVAGIQAKAKRRGNVTSLSANVVYQDEVFEVLMGDEDRIVHRRDLSKVKVGKEIAVYAIATMKDGTKEREVMSWSQVQDVRAASGQPDSIPWTKWTDEMARKTAIRRLAKRLPSLDDGDDDLKTAIERVDELYPFGKSAPVKTLEASPESKPVQLTSSPVPERPAAVKTAPDVRRSPAAQWLAALRSDLALVTTEDDLHAIANDDAVKDALQNMRNGELADLKAMLAETFERVSSPDDVDPNEPLEAEFPGDRP